MSYSGKWTYEPTQVVKAHEVCSSVTIQEVGLMFSRVSRRASTSTAAVASLAAVGFLALALGFAPSARADLLNLGALTGSNCDDQLSQPFSQFGDGNDYYPVPGGTFESGLGDWSTTGDAGVTAGNEPWLVNDSSDGSSLSLSPGSSATSPATCVSVASPTMRFFARGSGGSSDSSLSVEVLVGGPNGLLALPIGSVSATGDWNPTPAYLMVANVLSLLGGNTDAVAFRFTPHGDATWQIDDLYVDPWSKG
jgi:hypothetical protein